DEGQGQGGAAGVGGPAQRAADGGGQVAEVGGEGGADLGGLAGGDLSGDLVGLGPDDSGGGVGEAFDLGAQLVGVGPVAEPEPDVAGALEDVDGRADAGDVGKGLR